MGIVKEYWEKLTEICKKNPKGKPYDDKGMFFPDPTPMAAPIGQEHVADIDMFEVMRHRIRNEASIQAQIHGFESFEEADDFEIEDDFEPFSPWEEITEQFRPDGPVIRPEKQESGEERGERGGSPNKPPAKPAAPKPGKNEPAPLAPADE